MANAKPRRSIFDTLKRQAGSRLDLAAAAKVADRISHFPEPTAEEEVVPFGTTNESNQTVQPNSTTIQHDHLVQPDEPNGTTTRCNQSNQVVQPDGTTERYNQTVQPAQGIASEPNLVEAKPRRLTPQQQRVLDHLTSQGPHITDKSILSEKLGIAPFTIRNILVRLTDLGLIARKRVGQGMRVEVIRGELVQPNSTTKQYNRAVQPSSTTERYDSPPLKIDRLKTLSISLETIRIKWPTLARAGFGPEQLAQIEAVRTETGEPCDRVVQGLDHLEYELANDLLRDKAGQPVADPCSWAFRALAQNGYYRRPKGYVSPEEQAARDAEAEAKAVTAARQQADQARYEAWRDALTPDELAQAMQGHPGGNKEAWLKKMWKAKTV